MNRRRTILLRRPFSVAEASSSEGAQMRASQLYRLGLQAMTAAKRGLMGGAVADDRSKLIQLYRPSAALCWGSRAISGLAGWRGYVNLAHFGSSGVDLTYEKAGGNNVGRSPIRWS